MSRVINTDNPGRKRNHALRTCAEILRHLSQKRELDDEAKDMLAHVVYNLREIDATIQHSAEVWEGRNYWVKAEELRTNWDWVNTLSDRITALLTDDDWDEFPAIIADLIKHVGDVRVKKFTRSADEWAGAYERLLAEGETAE